MSRRAIGAVAAIILPALALLLWALGGSIRAERESARLVLQEAARAQAASIDGQLRSTVSTLRALSTSPLLARGDWKGFQKQAAEALAGEAASIILFDVFGQQLLNTLQPASDPRARNASRLAMEVIRTRKATISDLEVPAGAGTPTITVAIPVPRDGAARYALAKTIPRDLIDLGSSPGEALKHVFSAVFDSRGSLVASRGQIPEGFGNSKFWEAEFARDKKQGAFFFKSERGVKFYAAFARPRQFEWMVIAAVPVDTLNAPFNNALLLAGSGLAASALIALLVAQRCRRRTIHVQGTAHHALEASRSSAPDTPKPVEEARPETNGNEAAAKQAARRDDQLDGRTAGK